MTDLLCSITYYQTVTGDTITATAEVERELTNAQQQLVETLGRPLLQAERTERCPLLPDPETGQLACFPIVTPVMDAGDLTVQFDVVFGATPVSFPLTIADYRSIFPPAADITYTGGFDPDQDDPTARDYPPVSIRRDIAWCAYSFLRPAVAAAVPAGATSVRVGDVGATFDRAQSPGTSGVSWSPDTLRWRRRRL